MAGPARMVVPTSPAGAAGGPLAVVCAKQRGAAG